MRSKRHRQDPVIPRNGPGHQASVRVVLADDHAVVRAGIRKILETASDIDVVAEAGNGTQAIEAIGAHAPDVAVLDVRMPEASGIDVTRWIRENAPSTAVLVLSAYDDDPYVLAVLQAGANGYVLKSSDAEDIVRAVRAVHAGKSALDPEIARKVLNGCRATTPKRDRRSSRRESARCSPSSPRAERIRPSAPLSASARAPSRDIWQRSSASCRQRAARRR